MQTTGPQHRAANVRFQPIVLKNSKLERRRFSAEGQTLGESDTVPLPDCAKFRITNFRLLLLSPRIKKDFVRLRG